MNYQGVSHRRDVFVKLKFRLFSKILSNNLKMIYYKDFT